MLYHSYFLWCRPHYLLSDQFHPIALLESSELGLKHISSLTVGRSADHTTNISYKRKKQQDIILLLLALDKKIHYISMIVPA